MPELRHEVPCRVAPISNSQSELTNRPQVDIAHLKREFQGARFLIVPGHFDFFGGAERQAVLLARHLVNHYDCQVDFLGWGGDGILADEVRASGCHPYVFPLDTNQRGIRFLLRLRKLARFIRTDIRPDYLLPFVSLHCKIIGSIWKRTGSRFTWWNQRDEGRLVYGTRREHRLLTSLPAVVSNSWEGRDFLIQKFSLAESRIRVINNGIVIPDRLPCGRWRREYGIDAGAIVFTMVANLSKYKDHITLLNAFAILRQREIGSRCHLVLAGRSDDMTQELKALAFDLRLSDCVHFTGAISPQDVQLLLTDTDVVVHSSTKEGCPNGALEAMACERCVVGTDISGMRQALGADSADACLAPPKDPEALAQRMSEMAANPDRRKAFGTRNRQRIETEFSVGQMAEQVLDTVFKHRVTR